MNDCTAAALSYGIYKTDLPADKPTNVAFVDCGASDTTVSIVEFVKGKLKVLSAACERHLGGEDFTRVIAEHFNEIWKEKHGIDAHTNKKAWFRLMVAAEKTKKVLSSNPQAPIAIECFMNDIDVKGMLERDEFLGMCAPLMAKLETVIRDAFAGCGISKEEIATVEIVGGSSRVPAVQKAISEFFGRECSKTLNFDECIAKGCALQAAMLSPAFKVREFEVKDVTLYPIALSWSPTAAGAQTDAMEVEGEADAAPKAGASSSVVFQKFNAVPNSKMLTFSRKGTFTLSAAYDDSVSLPGGFSPSLNEFTISDIPQRLDAEGKPEASRIKATPPRSFPRARPSRTSPPLPGLACPTPRPPARLAARQVKLKLDLNGVLSLESAVVLEEEVVIEEAPPAEPAPAPAPEAPAGGEAPAEGAEAADAEAAPEPEPAPAPAPAEEKKRSKKVKRIPVTVSEAKSVGMSAQELMEAQEEEGKMAIEDKRIKEKADAMNQLEETIYSMRDKLSTSLSAFSTEDEKSPLMALLTSLEDWLYEDGMDVEKSVYDAKYAEIMDKCGPIEARAREADLRPDAIGELRKALARFSEFVGSSDEAYAHIEADDKAKVAAEVEAATAWLSEAEAKLAASPATADAPIKSAEITAKASALEGVCNPIMRKPKPAPKVEAAPPSPAPAEAEPAPAAEGDDAAAEPAAAPPPPAGADMDVD